MKKVFLIFLSLSILLLFSGCCLSHDWVDANCTAPKTCSKCEKTEGEPLGHHWEEATCTAPKTCASCGITEGEKLPHSFGEEEIQKPDYVKATALFVKTCVNCGTQGQRRGDLEQLTSLSIFLLTPEEFSQRFTNMLMDMQGIFGKDQYLSFIGDETKSDTLKMFVAKKTSNGNTKIVGTFEITDPNNQPLLPSQKDEANIFGQIRGTVTGKDEALLAMLSLWRATDPQNTLEEYLNCLEGIRVISPPNANINKYFMPKTQSVTYKVTHKGGSTYEFFAKAQSN